MREPKPKPRRLARCALAALFLAGAASADSAGPVQSDLDGDGVAERFTLLETDGFTGDGAADLVIETPRGTLRIPDIAWAGGPGQQPGLSLAPNGSLRLTSMNEAIGRDRWRLTLTIAYRQGAYRIAGYTYAWYDTLDLEDRGTCDLNLLTGRGLLTIADDPARPVRTTLPALPVTEWRDDTPAPDACRAR
jgi:hypothetical protein